jgi:hypothetical protein
MALQCRLARLQAERQGPPAAVVRRTTTVVVAVVAADVADRVAVAAVSLADIHQ